MQSIQKGVIIAGGLGTRLRPLTKTINKQLLPVYDKPLIYYPLELLIESGITSILIISGPEHSGQLQNQLGSGSDFGPEIKLAYQIQDQPRGIAQALGLAEEFAGNDNIAVILGDNIFEDKELIKAALQDFPSYGSRAHIFLKAVSDPERFGVASFNIINQLESIEEKPAHPTSNLAITGLYLYKSEVFNIIRTLQPSARGELEISDVNRIYVEHQAMCGTVLKGEWIDAGTFDSLLKASNFIAAQRAKSRS